VNGGPAGSTIGREINTIRAILNFAASEAGGAASTAFLKLFVDAKRRTKELYERAIASDPRHANTLRPLS